MSKGRTGNHAPLFRGSGPPRSIYRLKSEGWLLPGRYSLKTARALALAALVRRGVTLHVVPEPSTWFVALRVADWRRRGYSTRKIADALGVSDSRVRQLHNAYDKAAPDVMEGWKRGEIGLNSVLESIGWKVKP